MSYGQPRVYIQSPFTEAETNSKAKTKTKTRMLNAHLAHLFGPIFGLVCLFYAFLALFGPLYGLFGQFLALFNDKNIILALLGKKFPEKLSGLSVKGGGVTPPFR